MPSVLLSKDASTTRAINSLETRVTSALKTSANMFLEPRTILIKMYKLATKTDPKKKVETIACAASHTPHPPFLIAIQRISK